MRNKIGAALANAKIEASAMADRIEANRKSVEDMSLFPDFAQVCIKPADDFSALMAMRLQQRKEAEEKRFESERARIRAEEQAKAEHEAKLKAQAEQDARDAETARQLALEQDRMAKERAELKVAQDEAIRVALATERAEREAKEAAQAAIIQAKAPAQVVIEHQDEIAAFMASRDFGKDAWKIRAALVEFVKFTESRNSHEQV